MLLLNQIRTLEAENVSLSGEISRLVTTGELDRGTHERLMQELQTQLDVKKVEIANLNDDIAQKQV